MTVGPVRVYVYPACMYVCVPKTFTYVYPTQVSYSIDKQEPIVNPPLPHPPQTPSPPPPPHHYYGAVCRGGSTAP